MAHQVSLECNDIVLAMPELENAVGDAAKEMGGRAKDILTTVRATTPYNKLSGPAHLTYITTDKAEDGEPPDWLVKLHAPNPIAVEFGHQPSGWFAGTDTHAPDGLYILYKAAGMM